MKKNTKIAALIVALVFALTLGCGAFSAFASEDLVATAPAASSSDVSGADVSATDAAHLADYELAKVNVKQHRFSMLLPKLDTNFNAAMSNAELGEALAAYGGVKLEDILNGSDYYGGTYSYIYNGQSADGTISAYVIYSKSNYSEFIGSYNKLDDNALEDIRANTELLDTTNECILRSCNGTTFIQQDSENAETGEYTTSLKTVLGGGEYQILISCVNPDAADLVAINTMINSINLSGFDYSRDGIASNTLAVILAVVSGLLLLAVILLIFFIVRFSRFEKAAGSSFNIIGFNMPGGDDDDDDDD